MAGKRKGEGAAVMDRPAGVPVWPGPDTNKPIIDGMTVLAESRTSYLFTDDGKCAGADVVVWHDASVSGVPMWRATIRWKPDLLSGGTGGQFEMTYPNPGGSPDYVIVGRQQLQPMVDQAVRLGQEAVFGAMFVT